MDCSLPNPLSMGSPGKNTGVLPILTAGDLPDTETESAFLASAVLAVGFLTTWKVALINS